MKHYQTKCPACNSRLIVDHKNVPDRFHGRATRYRLVRCSTCSLVWISTPPRIEEIATHYNPEYNKSIAAAGDSSLKRARNRKQTIVQYKQGGVLLDIGCSTGSFLKAMTGAEWDLYGIEMSSDSAERAIAETGATVFVGDILDATFGPSTFDVITCFHVFEHLYEPHEVLSKILEWLKPGGIFYVLVPNIESAGAHIFRSYWYALEIPRHVFHYSPKSLTRMARSHHLQPISLKTHRELFIEQSTRYIVDDIFRTIGVLRTPLAKQRPPNAILALNRKLIRFFLFRPLARLASLAGDGESIHAVFQKNEN